MFHHPDVAASPYIVIAYYHLVPIADPELEVAEHKNFVRQLDASCRVYISSEGINAQMCFSRGDAQKYMEWLQSRPQFSDVFFKLQGSTEQVFPRISIKHRPLVAFGVNVPMDKRGEHVSPAEWRRMLEEEKDILVVDIRNLYEWELGHFENAEPVPHNTFREFYDYAQGLKKRLEESPKKVMMYCTGGIRCEYFSALLRQEGIDQVYQLNGGVINYGECEGANKWDGALFVFDDRLSVPVGSGSSKVIGSCFRCSAPTESFYNCANMDCNELFLSCEACLEELSGCCCAECTGASRLRPFQFAHTPFRRWYNYAKTKKELVRQNAGCAASNCACSSSLGSAVLENPVHG